MCTSKCIFRVVPFYGEQESASPALEFGLLEGTPLHDVFAFLTPSDKYCLCNKYGLHVRLKRGHALDTLGKNFVGRERPVVNPGGCLELVR